MRYSIIDCSKTETITTGFRGTRRSPLGTRRRSSPRVAHGEAPTAITGMAKAEFAVCQISGTRQTTLPCVCRGTWRRRDEFVMCHDFRHTAKIISSPCARARGTRQRMVSSPCAASWHTANCAHFTVCQAHGTRQSNQKQPVLFRV